MKCFLLWFLGRFLIAKIQTKVEHIFRCHHSRRTTNPKGNETNPPKVCFNKIKSYHGNNCEWDQNVLQAQLRQSRS